jgi:ADP-ribosyl-[dinitrogen reductase] hydrolase
VTKELRTKTPSDRFTGAFLGLASGDALGAPAEFLSQADLQARFGHLTEMVGGGVWKPGEWTDDTGMALCVAEGILEAPGDPVTAIGERFIDWAKTAKDVGNTISSAIRGFDGSWALASQSTPQAKIGKAAGNGSLMRTLPVALAYPSREDMLRQSARVSAMTHWDPQAEVSCSVYCLWVRSILEGEDPAAAWAHALEDGRAFASGGSATPETPGPSPLPPGFWERLEAIPEKALDELQPTGYAGYVVECLEAAVNRVLAEETAEQAIVSLVNLAGEADTMAAVAGGVAGAFFGVQGLPERWLDALHERQRIEEAGRKLATLRHEQVYEKLGLPELAFGRAGKGLLAGRNLLTGEDVTTLLDHGVSAVLDLREETEWSRPRVYGREAIAALEWCGVPRLNVAIPDGAPPRDEDLDRACEFLSRHTHTDSAGQGSVYIHCRAGLERTGAVLVAWVARRDGLDYESALERVRQEGWWVKPLGAQAAAVKAWLGST